MRNLPLKILVVNLGGIGDFLFSTPALRAIAAKLPSQKVSLLVVPRVVPAAAKLPYIGKINTIETALPTPQAIFTIFKLRREKFDLAINMRSLTSWVGGRKIQFLLNIIHPKQTAGLNTAGMGGFFDIKIPEPLIAEKHELEYHNDIAAALGANVTDKTLDLRYDTASTNRLSDKYRISPQNIVVGIHPGGMPSRRWPPEYFAAVIDALAKKIPAKFILTGSRAEKSLTDRIEALTTCQIINAAGGNNFDELCAIIKRCNLYIANDTGPMHLAAILNTPLIAIMGPGQINRYNPQITSPNAVIAHKDVNCSPCNRRFCDKIICLRKILPQEIIAAAQTILKI